MQRLVDIGKHQNFLLIDQVNQGISNQSRNLMKLQQRQELLIRKQQKLLEEQEQLSSQIEMHQNQCKAMTAQVANQAPQLNQMPQNYPEAGYVNPAKYELPQKRSKKKFITGSPKKYHYDNVNLNMQNQAYELIQRNENDQLYQDLLAGPNSYLKHTDLEGFKAISSNQLNEVGLEQRQKQRQNQKLQLPIHRKNQSAGSQAYSQINR